jgi:hypothetical protein
MRLPVLSLVALSALTGCASTDGAKLAVCDGKHLRPANAHGSVLAPNPTGQTPPPPVAGRVVKPRKLSSAASLSSVESCA